MSGSAGRESDGAIHGIAHVAIAVRDADAVAERFVAAFSAVRGGEEALDGGALRVLFLHLGPVTLELLEPRSPDHTVARFLAARGPGLHHVSLEVDDVAKALARARAAGVEAVDPEPRTGAHGSRVAFLHPQSLFGVLVELCQSENG